MSDGVDEVVRGFAPRLLVWFAGMGATICPGSTGTTPYRVWVSEVMLQQTQVATVIPYYRAVHGEVSGRDVPGGGARGRSAASVDGLGLLRAGAQSACRANVVVADYSGEFPQTLDAMMSLPGIGRSTAGAIFSVVARRASSHPGRECEARARTHVRHRGDPSSNAALESLVVVGGPCTPQHEVGAYTQAIMDLGATVCTRSRPAVTPAR